MARRSLPSISTPIILASIAVPIAIALLVGWTLVFARNMAEGEEVAQNVWLLVLGVVAFITLMSVLIMFAIYLGREILEVRRQDIFIDSVTHELKSPLASIKLGLQTLGRQGVDPDKRELLREMMLDDVDRLSELVDDILQSSRLASDVDRPGFDLSPVDLRELVEDCAENVAMRHRLSEDAIDVDVASGLAVTSDRAALTVVIRNLIDNAVKYSDEPVHVEVGAEAEKDRISIWVRDRGMGIPKKDLKKVFQRFYRVPSEGVRSRRGTGLGLFVVSALVRNLGGRVAAESDGPGSGTTMTIVLPSGGSRSEAAA